MLYHVIVRYNWENNPTTQMESMSQLVEFSQKLDVKSENPGVQKKVIYWGVNEPVGYGIFEAEEKEKLEQLILKMPGQPEITIRPVETLLDAVGEGQEKLAANR